MSLFKVPPSELTVEMVSNIISYNKDSGEFTWMERRGGKSLAGTKAGSVKSTGYVLISLYGHRYRAHHLAWFIINGSFPSMLDHVNGIRSDNRICNLREANHSQNMMNKRFNKKHSTSARGVYVDSRTGKYRVEVSIDSGKFRSKSIDNLEDAEALSRKIRSALHGEFCNHGDV